MNTQMMNSRQADEDRAEALEFAIEARAAELMTHGEACDPFDGCAMCLALDNSSINEMAVLGELLAEKKFEQVGTLLHRITSDYWSKRAYQKAKDELT
jgi:hypothetical protein